MSGQRYEVKHLQALLERRKIATMRELKAALGTTVRMTVFRKLRELSYRTSYSHGGRYYTLDRIAQFDEYGLWSYRSVWFSRHGTLMATLEALVAQSEAGCFAHELKERLHVSVKESVLRLVKRGRIARDKTQGLYLYVSTDSSFRKRQLLSRRARDWEGNLGLRTVDAERASDKLKAAIILFVSLLDEKQQRLYAGLEALKIGQGGDVKIAELIGLHPHTVARGRRELQSRDLELDRVRRAGGGRKALEKKRRRSSRTSNSF